TITIREDDPMARTVRIEQATTALNRAAAALSVQVFARRFDPGRGLASPGLALNLGGRQVLALSSDGGGAGGATMIGLPPAGAGAAAGTAIALAPAAALPAETEAVRAGSGAPPAQRPAEAPPLLGLAALDLGAPAELAAAQLEGLDSVSPATKSRTLLQLLGNSGFSAASKRAGGGAALTGGYATGYAAIGMSSEGTSVRKGAREGEGDSRPSFLAPAASAGRNGTLDLGALAELAVAQLEGLDSISPATESRTLLQLLGNSGFSATSERGGGNTLSLWGRGNYMSLEGEPLEGGTTYDYDGDSYGFYLGLDGRYDAYLLGLAVGYTAGAVELRAASGPAAGEEGDRSDFESELVAVYPYAAWQPSDRLSMWLLAGYGQGELEIAERIGATRRKASSDTELLLGAAGFSWRLPAADGLDMLLRLWGTALHGETDGGRFDDGIVYAKTETNAQQLRSEVELGQVFGFDDGGRLRPYLRAGVSYDFGDGARDAAAGEFGVGYQLHWPRLGLETELEIQARLTSKDDRDYREYGGTGMLLYDLGGDRRGLSVALRPSLGLAQGAADGLGAAGMPLDGGAFGGAGTSGLGGAGHDAGLGLRSELAYGIGGVRLARGLPGLLTLYGKSGLASGASSYGGGLRFEADRFALDAGLRRDSGADADRALLLDATLRF
ncbi:MAG: autotransporter outer membrane beta-barrel domain-containing protein, partial [Gammaproteobacteria bacterium]|nr:autotransporter outer membrane beta-barrel domain-containing protein [Gammaproteobacteria bacterium]